MRQIDYMVKPILSAVLGYVRKMLIVCFLVFLCVLLLALTMWITRMDTRYGARNPLPSLALVGLELMICGALVARFLNWTLLEYAVGFLPIEIVIGVICMKVTGGGIIQIVTDKQMLQNLVVVHLLLLIPWLIGYVIGAVWGSCNQSKTK